MRRFALAVVLVCALSSTALAGDVHTIDAPAPPAPPAPSPVVTTVVLTIIRIVVR